jgi:hypothetical protein
MVKLGRSPIGNGRFIQELIMTSHWLLCDRDRLEAMKCIGSIFGKKVFLDAIVLLEKFARFGKNNRLASDI